MNEPSRVGPPWGPGVLVWTGTIVWALLILFGSWKLWQHNNTPGADIPPDDLRLSVATDRPTVVFITHPHCPCSRASLAELAWVLDRAEGPVAVRVLVVVPPGAPVGWERSRLWDEAQRLPGATVVVDDGVETRKYGAKTSGLVLVFGTEGRLRYRGGITLGRGHRGSNTGREAALAALRGETVAGYPVFGCPLFDDVVPE